MSESGCHSFRLAAFVLNFTDDYRKSFYVKPVLFFFSMSGRKHTIFTSFHSIPFPSRLHRGASGRAEHK